MPHSIVTNEQNLLADVRTLLDEEPYIVPPREADIVKELLRLREDMPHAKGEDLGSLQEQFNQQYALLGQLRATRDKPQVDPDSPYFAHIQLTEEGKSRDVFLGKATRIARGVRIVDWRNAPISRIFYAYQQGEEYEEELGGRYKVGNVTVRRTVTIRMGELERIDAPEGTFQSDKEGNWEHVAPEPPRLAGGEGAAMRAHQVGEGERRQLGTDMQGNRRRSDKRLPDIAGLIDPDQFDLITRPQSGFVVIRGTAGSGKTTVALHRIAYLAYEDNQINTARTLFVVFSPALREYVQHVLPSLGVPRAQVKDFRGWASEQRKHHFPRLPKKYRDTAPGPVLRLKIHPVMLEVLKAQVERVTAPPTPEQAVDDWVSALTDAKQLREVLGKHAPGEFKESDIERITSWCRGTCEEVISWMEGDKEQDGRLDIEDDVLLLRAWQLRIGPLVIKSKGKRGGRRQLTYRHIAIDEVQDFSPLEVRVLLGCLDSKQSITLAGDTQQHVMKDAGFTSWADFFGHLGLEGTAVNTLKIAYRSSKPIVDFALKLLGPLAEDTTPPMVTRGGPPVELFQFTDHGACVAFLADALKELSAAEPLASIAVLVPDDTMASVYYRGLDRGEVPRLRRVDSHDFTFAPGVEVCKTASVKGLEFDYVVLVEVSAACYPDSDEARRLLHVGATRAVHQLWLTSVGSLSPILREATP